MMNQYYFQKWVTSLKNLQQPFQEMTQLNMQTIKNFSYLKPGEVTKLDKPQELLEKHLSMALENGHNILNYMQNSIDIFEKSVSTMKHCMKDGLQSTEEMSESSMSMANPIIDPANPFMNAACSLMSSPMSTSSSGGGGGGGG